MPMPHLVSLVCVVSFFRIVLCSPTAQNHNSLGIQALLLETTPNTTIPPFFFMSLISASYVACSC